MPTANLRAARYYIARTRAACPHCAGLTTLTALALGPGHETRDEESDDWHAADANAFCCHLAAVSPSVYSRLRSCAPNFQFVSDETAGISCWVNHCRHCGSAIGDDELHGEPGIHGFVPCSKEDAAKILLIEVREAFEACAGGYAFEPEFFAFLQRA